MVTIKTLLDTNKLQKKTTDIVKSELGEDKDVVVQTRFKDDRIEFFVITTIGNLNFNMSLNTEPEYLEYFIITELQDAQNKLGLKLAYELMCDCEFKKIANKIKKRKSIESKLKVLLELDTLLRDVFINSNYGRLLYKPE